MEGAVGKTVDRENVAIFAVEPALEIGEGVFLGEFTGGGVAEAKADGVRLAGGDAVANGECVLLGLTV